MIKTIIFDLGHVVIDFDWKPALQKVMTACDASPDEIYAYFTDPANDRLFVEGKISAGDFYEQIQAALGLRLSFEAFRAVYADIFYPMPDVEAIIKKLEKKYTLGVLSNTNEIHFPYVMEKFPVLNYFDSFILSYEEKTQKPHYEIYARALEVLQSPPNKTVFIDDIQENVIAASQIGMRAIHFSSAEKLIADLNRFGVSI